MPTTLALAILAALLSTSGQLFLTQGMRGVGYIGRTRLFQSWVLVMDVAKSPFIIVGMIIYVLAAVAWLIVLSRAPLSVVYPFVGITYVAVTLFARMFLKEQIGVSRWAGIVLVIVGVATVGFTAS